MIGLSCLFARGDHAARCPRCRAAADQDRSVRAVVAAAGPSTLSPRARDDAFARALARPAVIRPRRWRPILIPAGLALAAAAAVVIVISLRDAGAPAPAPRALAAGATTAVGHGRVTLASGGVAWQTGPTEITLVAGSVEVEVDPAPHRPFTVRARWFTVDVLGTVFTVDPDSVAVSRGAVRVSGPTGGVLVERLAAGERWTRTTETAAIAVPAAPAVEPSPDEPAEIAMSVDDGRAGPAPHSHAPTAAPSAPAPNPTDLVTTARSQLAVDDNAAARQNVEQLLALHPSRAIRAEAEALLADSYKDENLATAIKRYRAVADAYPDLATGEAALFSAARLSEKIGRTADARQLYRTYLERYPHGAMADRVSKALERE